MKNTFKGMYPILLDAILPVSCDKYMQNINIIYNYTGTDWAIITAFIENSQAFQE
jgi:hypothetical protein